jgi:hypothetical protein
MYTQPSVIVMLDIESLDIKPNAIVTQMAALGWHTEDPDAEFIQPVQSFLPIQPQQELIPARTIRGSTIIWWMKQESAARERFQESDGEDFDELMALGRHFVSRVQRMIDEAGPEGNYEVYARGPQFDVVVIESLLNQLGLKAPWKYDKVRDLRTLMALAGISTADVPQLAGQVTHDALWDCKYQKACYLEATRVLRSR